GEEAAHGVQIALPSNGFFRRYQRIKAQETEFTVGKIRRDALFEHCLEISDSGDLAQTIQFAQVRLQIQIFQIAKTAARHFQWQFVRRQTMDWVKVCDGGLNPPDVFLAKRAADVQIKRGK